MDDPLLMNMREELQQREIRRQERHRHRAYGVPGQSLYVSICDVAEFQMWCTGGGGGGGGGGRT